MGLAEAAFDIIDILRGRSAAGDDGPDNWERILRIIAEYNSLPDREVEVIEKAIAEAYHGIADDNDDNSLCDASFNGVGYALLVEMLDEVTRAAWQDAKELKKALAKRPPQRKRPAE